MHDKWYGDNRDLVKWGVLLELTQRYQAQQILQVLYKRPSTWERLEIDGEQVELPATVIHHFRDATSVSAMQCPARVEVVSETFGDRSDLPSNCAPANSIPCAASGHFLRLPWRFPY